MRTRFLRWNKKHFSSSVKGFSRQKLSQTWKCAFKVLCYLPESLFYKINTCLQKTTTCIGLRPEHIFSVNFQYIYFFNSGLGFYRSFLCYLQLLIIKRFWNSFFYIALLLVWLQTVWLRFLKSYFRLEPCKVNHNTKLHCHCLLLDQGAHIFFWKEKQSRSFVFFTKKGFSWISCFSWDHM